MKKMYAYRFMLPSKPTGTLQEGFIEAHHHHHAKAKARKICRDEVLEAQGKWSDWGERDGVYGCSFLDERTGRYGFRLILAEVPKGIPEDTAGDDHPPTPIHRLLPAW